MEVFERVWTIPIYRPTADKKLSLKQWDKLFEKDEIAATTRWVTHLAEHPPTLDDIAHLSGHLPQSPHLVYMVHGGRDNAQQGPVHPSIIHFSDNELIEHLVVDHGITGINEKEADNYHRLDHWEPKKKRAHPRKHEHTKGVTHAN